MDAAERFAPMMAEEQAAAIVAPELTIAAAD